MLVQSVKKFLSQLMTVMMDVHLVHMVPNATGTYLSIIGRLKYDIVVHNNFEQW